MRKDRTPGNEMGRMRINLVTIFIMVYAGIAQSHLAGAEVPAANAQIQEENFRFDNPLRVFPQHHIPGLVVVYYDVRGDTAAKLRAELDVSGPMNSKGQRSDSLTRWSLEWHWPTTDGSPVFEETEVQLRLSVAFPRWLLPEEGADPKLLERWRKFSLGMARHELGHIEQVLSAYPGLRDEIIQAAKEKPKLSAEEANALARKYVEKMQAADDRYDERTGRGKAQGATFP